MSAFAMKQSHFYATLVCLVPSLFSCFSFCFRCMIVFLMHGRARSGNVDVYDHDADDDDNDDDDDDDNDDADQMLFRNHLVSSAPPPFRREVCARHP